jgi:predicted nucleotidyltransferase
LPAGIKEPISFAVAIHHTDRGLLGDNIEKPDVQAILDGIVDNSGNIRWHDEVKKLTANYFPEEVRGINIVSLKEMARGLRVWAKGCGFLEQHQRRLQASFAHHILKLCDISAAAERKEYEKKNEQDYYGGWLMVENIKNYVEMISLRERAGKMQEELQRWTELLKTQYQPDKIILFGSFARREIRRWSDIDLIVIKRTEKKFLDRIKDVLLLLRPKVGIDILIYTPDEFNNLCRQRLFFKNEIEAKGMIIYERRSQEMD